ncbi:hypothetical protein FQR65_LT02112 [Abscondita terminalis]|nr:hypothetical protein FQR65_LT02112 [Abscondita terminalis]
MNEPKKGNWDGFPSLQNKLKNLNISKDKREINILLLGETGVGKSTFINAFFNYLSFSTLYKARNEKLQVVIPSQFTITDENYEERLIRVGKDHNESIEIGASATQSCRSYVYPMDGTNIKIRLIDTPGVGDTRGIDQDNANFENVLSFIGELKHLNAICILLKPNNARLTVMFEFCIKQLLSRLDKSASENLIFVFTNTRSTFYRPGETLPALKRLLTTFKGIDIRCEKKNIFCTDNESFRFLAALKNKVKFSGDDVKNFSQSWIQSYEECTRMIMYIAGDDNNPGLTPHEVKNTISINEARRLIVQLSQPLAEIAQLVQDNIRAVDYHQRLLRDTNTSLTELKSKLYIPFVDLKVTKLDQPTTVCTSVKCSTLYQVADRNKWHYHQRCHDPCYLTNVPREIIGSPELVNCASMNQNGECKKCSCRFQVHMHIYYVTETFQNQLEDAMVKTSISSKEQAWQSAQNLMSKMNQRLSTLNKERDAIIKTTAKFACFLKTNAIAPYNDAYEAYIKYLIDREKSMSEACDVEMIKQLERMLREYTEEKITIMNAISQAKDNTTVIKADDIFNAIRSLYSLEIFGVKIRELFEAQNRARKDENKSQFKEFIFEGTGMQKRGQARGRGRGRGRPAPHHNQRQPQFSVNAAGHHFQQNIRPNQVFETDRSFWPSTSFHDAPGRVNITVYHSRDRDGAQYPQSYEPISHNQWYPPPLPPPYNSAVETPQQHREYPSREYLSRDYSGNTLHQPHYHNQSHRGRRARSRGRKPNKNKHNLNPSSSSDSESDYFSSFDRHN